MPHVGLEPIYKLIAIGCQGHVHNKERDQAATGGSGQSSPGSSIDVTEEPECLATIYLANLNGQLKETSIEQLIPDSFSKDDFMDQP